MKKIMRKGFTLVELLVVLTVIGILSTMFTMSGREASNIARANKIVEDFHIISAAMNLYYSGNVDACNLTADATDGSGIKKVDAKAVLEALKGYLKSTTYIEAETTATAGKFNITVDNDNGKWWLTYTLPDTSLKLGRLLENRALQEGFVSAQNKSAGTYADRYVAEEGTEANAGKLKSAAVWYQVR